eukprot:2964303-Rhodomonas_salina.1
MIKGVSRRKPPGKGESPLALPWTTASAPGPRTDFPDASQVSAALTQSSGATNRISGVNLHRKVPHRCDCVSVISKSVDVPSSRALRRRVALATAVLSRLEPACSSQYYRRTYCTSRLLRGSSMPHPTVLKAAGPTRKAIADRPGFPHRSTACTAEARRFLLSRSDA